jgi:hypothetical protein
MVNTNQSDYTKLGIGILVDVVNAIIAAMAAQAIMNVSINPASNELAPLLSCSSTFGTNIHVVRQIQEFVFSLTESLATKEPDVFLQ